MPRARGSLGVPVGPSNSHHSLQGDVLILCAPFSRGGRGGAGAGAHDHFSSSPFRLPPSPRNTFQEYIYIYIYINRAVGNTWKVL